MKGYLWVIERSVDGGDYKPFEFWAVPRQEVRERAKAIKESGIRGKFRIQKYQYQRAAA